MAQKTARSGRPWLREMRRHIQAGDLTRAANTFDEQTGAIPYEAYLLRAKVHLKANEEAAARALLLSHRAPIGDRSLQIQHALLNATAHAVSGRFDVADEEFERAEDLLRKERVADLSIELAWRRTARFAAAGDLKRARQFLPEAKASESGEAAANAAFVEAYILSREGCYLEQAQVYLSLLERLEAGYSENEQARIYATWNLAILARETPISHVLPLVQRHIDAGSWPTDCTRQRFESLKAVGWCHALRGDYFNAFRYLKRALLETESHSIDDLCGQARRCVAHLDRAYLAQVNGELIFARQELEEAELLASRINWTAVTGEERVALLLLAELFAQIDVGKSTYYIARYDALPPLSDRWQHFSGDARSEHLANYCRAVVDLASGHKRSAIKLLKDSYSYYERIRYAWRAARCALRLFDATKDQQWSSRAREMLREYSASWLANELPPSPPRHEPLPPMQQKVFDYLCQGLSNAEIASEMKRSEYTIRNHVKAIFKRFHVRSRSALIAEAMKRSLI